MKQNPYHVNILEKMKHFILNITNGSFETRYWNQILFKSFGNLLKNSKLPKKPEDVYFIVEELEKMIESCIRVERLQDTQKYLVTLVEKIREIFFKTRIIEILKEKKLVKIILNDGKEIVITMNIQGITSDFIIGEISEEEDITIYFSDIKLDGILPLTTEETMNLKGWKKNSECFGVYSRKIQPLVCEEQKTTKCFCCNGPLDLDKSRLCGKCEKPLCYPCFVKNGNEFCHLCSPQI